jgi:hypothetical protein
MSRVGTIIERIMIQQEDRSALDSKGITNSKSRIAVRHGDFFKQFRASFK